MLFGGQDGWLGSKAFADQVPLWESGDFIQIPMREGSVRRAFTRRMQLSASK